ncbi:MAG: InlB B-repeat-containing protein, partial [Oscillospiraceae bacterium]|nr:InlB B-repeat-containing protein [Oscillospiraceae bacterium]
MKKIIFLLSGMCLGVSLSAQDSLDIFHQHLQLNEVIVTGLTGDSSLTVIIPTGSMENRSYTANWTETQYTITYDLAGGTASPANPGGYNTTTQTFTLTNPTKTGYTFAGWTGADLGSAMQSVTVTQGSTGNRSYTATWTKDTYTISYDLAGGSVTSANPTSYDVETNAFTLHNPTREHYTFAGWTGTGLDNAAQSVTVAKGSTGNRSYTAAWTPVNYSISYNLNGGNLAEGETNPNQYNIETTTFTLNNPIRTGYTFAGWTGTDLGSAAQSVTVAKGSTGNRSYTATWQVGYDLRFHRANGTIVTIGLTAAQNEAANATAPSLTDGYNFWWYGVDKSRVDGGAAINGILQSRDYAEYKYLVTFNDGPNTVQLPCDGSVTAPDGLPSGMVWRSGGNIYVDGGHEVSVSADTTFTSAARQSISSADVGITAPVYGNSPDPAATVSAAAPYTVGVVAWTRDGTPLAGTFARGVHYTATVTLTPKPGWQFTGGTDVTLGGRSATPTPNGDGTVTVSLDFFLPIVKGTDWTWAGDYSSAKVTVTYVLGDGTTAAETIDPAAVAAPATGGDGSVTYSATAAGSAAYGSQTVESTLTVTRSGGTVTGVTVKKRLNGAQTLNVTLTANGGTITENGGGDFSVSGASVTVVNGTTYTLHENGSARLTA